MIHEKNVENFYATGIKGNALPPNEGFLSFGYWKSDEDSYLDAAKNLLDFFIKNSGITHSERILNVASGYGAESIVHYNTFKPKELIGVDITQVHIDYANSRAKSLGLEGKVKFIHGDACNLDFPDNYFTQIFGIEGPAHFNTREKFFQSANRVLVKNGELILTDIMLGDKFNKANIINKIILSLTTKAWVIPKENWINEKEYRKQLEDSGFEIISFKKIGQYVFPGYAKDSISMKTFKQRLKSRGFFAALGLGMISSALGYVQKKGLIDYIYVKAKKV